MSFLTVSLDSEETVTLYNEVLNGIKSSNVTTIQLNIEQADATLLPHVLRKLTSDERVKLWQLVSEASPILAANLLDHFSDTELIHLVQALPLSVTTVLFQYIRAVDRRMLISHLPAEVQHQLKLALPPTWKHEEKAALAYPASSAGGICKSEILKVDESTTVADLGAILRAEEHSADRIEWRHIYLHDSTGAYLGTLKIRDIFLRPYSAKLSDYLDPSVPTVLPEQDLNTLKSILDNTFHPIIPVVDEAGFQIGAVGSKQLNEALYERSKQQLLEQSGIWGGDECRTMPNNVRNLRRLAFLIPSVILSYAAVSIIAAYEPIIEQIAVLAAILPLVANLSGAAGNQAVAVSIRELSTGHLSSKDLLYVVSKELPIGAINGILIGLVLTVLTLLSHGGAHVALPLLIGLAYAFSSSVAVVIGGSLPLLLKRLGLDPAMLSSPILTTLTDAISFFSVLYLAQSFLL
ncbi:magnesium transporter [Vibrio mediterranei]|uniref:Magnesium transporter n=1 Tax=Vibrio mediterranei TaxID=689 RepID=A0A3G4VF51_9VIBR|nr:magnesium transporter [Vibrio mediterranei]AYV23393.1 magnesium transporter [Vibrio mediterranei]